MARRTGPENGRGQTPGGMFLGAVVARPTSAQEAPMSAEFSLLAARFSQLLAHYRTGELDPVDLAVQLSAERVQDTDGGEWTIGASSGAWYHRVPGGSWTQVPPPGPHVRAVVRLVADTGTEPAPVPADPFATLYAPGPVPVPDQPVDPDLVAVPSFDGVVELYPDEPAVTAPPSPDPTDGDEPVVDPYVTDARGTALPGTSDDDATELARRWLDG